MSLIASEQSSLIKLKNQLDGFFGKEVWPNLEVETLAMEYGKGFGPLFIDKLSVLKILSNNPLLAFEDPVFFLYAAEVINNNEADFSHLPFSTLLETAYTILVVERLIGAFGLIISHPPGLVKLCTYLLNQEGCSEPIAPFGFVPASELTAGQTNEDTAKKSQAILEYAKHMESL